ncbi:MAG: hypothetical protein F6J93_40775 [Oscillatoria sp. SIO1A7]|nr:hypothetical protein [Oscillatoria sp. SIO1A7]
MLLPQGSGGIFTYYLETFYFTGGHVPSVRMRGHPKASHCRIYKKLGGATPSFFPGTNSRVGAIAPQPFLAELTLSRLLAGDRDRRSRKQRALSRRREPRKRRKQGSGGSE